MRKVVLNPLADVQASPVKFLENDMAESVIGSPVPALNCILIRGEQNLFCVTSEKSPLA